MAERKPHVLFVCVENSCRSQIAEGFARALAGAGLAPFSAGSHPSGSVDARAVRLMLERGIDLSRHTSKGLAALPQGIEWDAVVTMGCGDACPQLPARRRLDWELPDPKRMKDDQRFREVRDRIEELVRQLVAEESAANEARRQP